MLKKWHIIARSHVKNGDILVMITWIFIALLFLKNIVFIYSAMDILDDVITIAVCIKISMKLAYSLPH